MAKMLRLARQRLKADWKIHLAAMLLTVLACSAFLIYQAYMEQMGQNFSRQTEEITPITALQVELIPGEYMQGAMVFDGAWRSRLTPSLEASAQRLELNSAYGQLDVLALEPTPDYQGPLPAKGQVLVNESLAQSLPRSSGAELVLSNNETEAAVTLKVQGTFKGDLAGQVLVLWQDVRPLAKTQAYNAFLYGLPQDLKLNTARNTLQHFYRSALIIDNQQPQILAKQTLKDSYRSFGNLVFFTFTLLTLGVLTALLLSFMDSKRELSVLKSLGLTPGELWGIFLINGILTAVLGLVLGIGGAYGAAALLSSKGITLAILPEHTVSLLWRVAFAYALAISAPAALAKRATVNQLLYDQPIPIFSRQVTALRQRNLAFEERIAQGWQVLQLPVIEGRLEGFIFKQVGDEIKEGEVVGFSPGWWGLAYTEYVADVDGTVSEWQDASGMMVIEPHRRKKRFNPSMIRD